MNIEKYKPYPIVDKLERKWPTQRIQKAPIWCSVDLRDGNQALINPMGLEKKLKMFELLVELGFKEIEIGFPSASSTEYDFLRELITKDKIPDDVTIQVLCQAREHLIQKTVESLEGCKKAIFHLYNSTSTLQREVVFKKTKSEIIDIAVQGTQLLKEMTKHISSTQIGFEYSPESFTGTEIEYALEVCEAVLDIWQPTVENKMILNLPATVEMSTPNVYADQIEWFIENLKEREKTIISLHAHNDRGTAVAATELALLAGADRVEGTLFGNGERTGNVDIVTLALNLFSQGIDPRLDFSDINQVVAISKHCTELSIHERHPYVGQLVYTAFSGSHQDAIKKGIAHMKQTNSKIWNVPYLPIDPEDLGRTYEAIIRINSQSGKGGIAYILEDQYGFDLPKKMQVEFSQIVQKYSEDTEKEVSPETIYSIFQTTYFGNNIGNETTFSLLNSQITTETEEETKCIANISKNQKMYTLEAVGNGPIHAFANGIKEKFGIEFQISEYSEHALEKGSAAKAASYIQITLHDRSAYFGVGVHENTITASLLAIISAMNRVSQF